MSKTFLLVAATMLSLVSGSAQAQDFPQHRHHGDIGGGEVVGPPLVLDHNYATTVQLPTFSFFTISTTVSVPDSGTGFAGGVGGAGSSSRSNGLGSRAGASGVNAGGVVIGAQIHDLREMDRALLADKRAAEAQTVAEQRWIARVERAKESTAGRPTMSVAEARRRALAAR